FLRSTRFVFGLFFVALSALLVMGCAVSAQFHSRTGADYDAVAKQAIIVNEQEADTIAHAGGEVIGSISAQGMVPNATDDDVAEKSATVAAKKGGTHIVLTDRGEETFTQVNPATRNRQCQWVDGVEDCRTTYQPQTVSTSTEPTARYLVFRVPSQRWAALPAALRPVPAN
ncbi:MAG: hypothetical protein ABI183_23805, partial [Polyangiaceae bacterium]